MKYFVLGAIASGTLLYGMSLIYGVTGTLQLDELAEHFARPAASACSALISGSCSSSSASRSSSARCRSTCGCRTSTTARRRP